MKMTTKNTAFFSTSDNLYIKRAASALLTIRKRLPKANLFILSKEVSERNKIFLQKHNIKLIELDLNRFFYRTWAYPTECFYIFAGPEKLLELNFDFSVYIDGDVVCAGSPLLKDAPTGVAGVEVNTYREIFGGDTEILATTFSIKSELFNKKRLQSGIVYFNNNRMKEIHLLQESENIFDKCLKNHVPRQGDDSLFALLQLLPIFKKADLLNLPNKYNFMSPFFGDNIPNDVIFVHLLKVKPWSLHRFKLANFKNYYKYIFVWRCGHHKLGLWWSQTYFGSRFESKCEKRYCTKKNILAYSPIKRWINAKKTALKLYYYEDYLHGIHNFGDELSAELIHAIFGYNVTLAAIDECDLIAAGSIIEVAQSRINENKMFVWGSGFINDGPKNTKKNLVFCAVRGEKTRARIGKKITTGDPGLLASVIYKKSTRKTNKIGFIAHYADYDLPIVDKIRTDDRFVLINPLAKPAEVAMKISECKLILSSSLHGLIFSDSFGIPNYYVKLSDRLTGGTYKFQDYYSSINKDFVSCDVNDIFDDEVLSHLINTYVKVPDLKEKQYQIIKSFPFY